MADRQKKLSIQIVADVANALKGFVSFGKGAKKEIQEVEEQTKKSSKSMFEKLTSAANGFNEIKDAASAIIGKIVDVGKKIVEMAAHGSALMQMEKAFHGLATQAGLTGDQIDEVKDKLRNATMNMVADADLIKQANTAMLLGIDINKFHELAEVARAASIATGQDMGFMLESITTGVGRMSVEILDNLGITVKLEEVYQKHAATLGKNAEALSDVEKKQAVLNAVMVQGKKLIEATGATDKVFIPLTARLGQVRAAFQNMTDDISKGLTPVLNVLTRDFQGLMSSMSDDVGDVQEKTTAMAIPFAYLAHVAINAINAIKDGVKVMSGGWGARLQLMGDQASAFGRLLRDVWKSPVEAMKKFDSDLDLAVSNMKTKLGEDLKVSEPTIQSYREFSKSIREAAEAEAKLGDIKKNNKKEDDKPKPKGEVNPYLKEILEIEKLEAKLGEHGQFLAAMRIQDAEHEQAKSDFREMDFSRRFELMEQTLGREKALTLELAMEEQQRIIKTSESADARARAADKLAQLEIKASNAVTQAEVTNRMKTVQAAQQVGSAMAGLFGSLADLQIQNTARSRGTYKSLMRAQIAMSAAAGIAGAVAAAMNPASGPAAPFIAAANVGMVVASTAKALMQLEQADAGFSVSSLAQNWQQSFISSAQSQAQDMFNQGANASVNRLMTTWSGRPNESQASIGATGAQSLPMAAKGAYIKGSMGGTLLVAGEKGRDEMVLPLEDQEVMSRFGGMTVNLAIQNFWGTEEMARRLDVGLLELKRNGASAFANALNQDASYIAGAGNL